MAKCQVPIGLCRLPATLPVSSFGFMQLPPTPLEEERVELRRGGHGIARPWLCHWSTLVTQAQILEVIATLSCAFFGSDAIQRLNSERGLALGF